MPDLMLADVGTPHGKLQFVLIECVATGGAMTRERFSALRIWLSANGFSDTPAAFGTVFGDRSEAVFRRSVGELAWGSFVWFASEPDNLIVMLQGGAFAVQQTLDELAQRSGL
jgi:hypothetical protein